MPNTLTLSAPGTESSPILGRETKERERVRMAHPSKNLQVKLERFQSACRGEFTRLRCVRKGQKTWPGSR
jgi:2-methylaconitate cis-trans-isomerase PrpF